MRQLSRLHFKFQLSGNKRREFFASPKCSTIRRTAEGDRVQESIRGDFKLEDRKSATSQQKPPGLAQLGKPQHAEVLARNWTKDSIRTDQPQV